jgi:hypothetical protein
MDKIMYYESTKDILKGPKIKRQPEVSLSLGLDIEIDPKFGFKSECVLGAKPS